jgi:dynein heavy chain
MDQKIRDFQQTMPIITALRQESMRERHWAQLADELKQTCLNPQSDSFTLQTLVDIQIVQYKENIDMISDSATKELNIEVKLKDIKDTWEVMELDLTDYKKRYKKISATKDISEILEKNTVDLQSMKSSSHYIPFKDVVEDWEYKLVNVNDTLEMLLQVQRKWM